MSGFFNYRVLVCNFKYARIVLTNQRFNFVALKQCLCRYFSQGNFLKNQLVVGAVISF